MLSPDSGLPVHFFILQPVGVFFNQHRQQPVIHIQQLQLFGCFGYIHHMHNLSTYWLYPASATTYIYRYTDSYPVNARLWRR